MTAVARQDTVCILNTNTNPHIPHKTTTLADTDWPDWIDNPNNNNSISWHGPAVPQEKRPTVCIPDIDNTPWSNYTGGNVADWIDDTGKIPWHDSPLSTDNTTERTTPTVDTRNKNSLYVPLSEDDTFNDFDDSYTPTTNNRKAPPPPPN